MVSFGPFVAFVRLWIECIIVRPCSQAIVALTFAVYALKPFFPTCDPPSVAVILLAASCISEYAEGRRAAEIFTCTRGGWDGVYNTRLTT